MVPGGRPLRTTAVALLLVLALGACAGDPPGGEATPTSASATPQPSLPFDPPAEVDPELLAPLAGLGPCTATPAEAVDGPLPPGLVVPDVAVVTSVEEADPLTNVQGYVPWTPVQLRVWIQYVADIEVVQIEDEVRESEALVTDGRHRMFLKAQAICEMGSVFIAVIAPDIADQDLPTPAGGGSDPIGQP